MSTSGGRSTYGLLFSYIDPPTSKGKTEVRASALRLSSQPSFAGMRMAESVCLVRKVHYKTIGTRGHLLGDFVDIESTINYSSCLEPSLCMGKRGSTYAPVGTRERSNKEVVDGDERS
ncbi:hypothetical protein AAG906_019303 [Vitis piasezkii]